MSILLTGATGFVGSALLRRLHGDGCDVAALVRGPVASLAVAALPRYVGGPWGSADFCAALSGVTSVVHLAARVHVMRDKESYPLAAFRAVNVQGTLNLARQSAAAGVRRFVFVSSVKVNGEGTRAGCAFTEADTPAPQDAYGRSKYEAETGLRELGARTGMAVVIVRPPLVYGPGVKGNFASLLQAVQRGWPLPLGAVHNRRSLVALDNLVDFLSRCFFHPNAVDQTFLVSDGHDLSTTELVRCLAKAAGLPARLVPLSVWVLQAGAALLGKGNAVQRLCGNLQVDISSARSRLAGIRRFRCTRACNA